MRVLRITHIDTGRLIKMVFQLRAVGGTTLGDVP